jgi:hypothetical protein
MTTILGSLNIALPASRQAYRDIVESLDLTTEAGQKTYVAMLQMSEAADQYYQGLEDAQQKLIDAQRGVVDEFQGYVDKLKSARESMKMEGQTFATQQAASARLAFAAVLQQARLGDLSGIGTIDNAMSKLVENANSPNSFRTKQEYEANYYKTYNDIAELEKLAGTRLSTEEQTLNTLKDQLKVLNQIAGNTDNSRHDFFAPITNNYSDVPEFAGGGSFPGGYRIVGENGPELEYTGPSQITSNSQSKALLDNSEVVKELKSLREDIKAYGYAIAKNTGKSSKVLDRFDIDGLPDTRTLT